MSLEEKKSCCVCHAYLFPEDDIVYCPECGAPHHRDCYNAVGHCGLENLHGTPEQYDIARERKNRETEQISKENPLGATHATKEQNVNSVVCANCGNSFPAIMDHCPKCGAATRLQTEQSPQNPFFLPLFDPLGGVPKDMDLGQGVTAEEAKQFVISNSHRFIPKFAAMTIGKKASWNWLAFLFPSAWYMSRKMYLKGILSCLLLTAFSLLTLPVLSKIYSFDPTYANRIDIMNVFAEQLETMDTVWIIMSFLGSALNIITRIFIGIFADYGYRNHVIDTISKIKTSDIDKNEAFIKKGGTSFFGMIIGFFALQYLPSIILMFIV